MDVITLRVERRAGRYDGQRLGRVITGQLPVTNRVVVVEKDGQYTKIVAVDTSAVIASGHGLQSACKGLSEMYSRPVRVLDIDGRHMFTVYAFPS